MYIARSLSNRAALLLLAFLVVSSPVAAQPRRSGQAPPTGAASTEDPPAPVPPSVISRGDNGRVVVRATRIDAPLQIDGRLDEGVYQSVTPISGLIQAVPANGQPSTEKTEAWIMFDANYFYVTGKCYESVPPEKWTANELRRDTNQLRQNDSFGVLIDTFHDRRNGYNFYANPLGGFADQIVTDEGNPNTDWNPVWQIRTGRFDGGWTVEMAIPFKSIRYLAGKNQTWGLQLRRSIRRKNEWTHLTTMPSSNAGPSSIFRVSRAATLVGLDLPPVSSNVELKPYGISRLTSDKVRSPPMNNEFKPQGGLDMKYGITANLTADLTVNTDFAQVEVDEQQLNLTRFSLQFPEKRDFFLDGRGIFDFGRGGLTGGGGGGGGTGFGSGGNSSPTNGAPTLFYSRRIGLNAGRVIPIDVGGRVTGKVGKFSVGALNLEARNEDVSATPRTNFTVMRVKRDILRRSSIGAMISNRSESTLAPGATNQAYGVDGQFSFFQDLNLGGYYATSDTEGRTTDSDSYQARFDYAPDRWGVRFDQLKVGRNYNPEVGFTRRLDFNRSYGSARFSPRPKRSTVVRKYTWEGTFEYLVNGSDQLESRARGARFLTEFQNSDQFNIDVNNSYELLVKPFTVSPGVAIPVGGYPFTDVTMTYGFGQQRRASGSVALQAGQFYDGHITALTYSGGRVAVRKQWSVEPSVTLNTVTLPAGDFTTTILRTRTDYGFSPRMFMSALVQYSSADRVFSSNFRYRWEYRPGSELFVVYTDERDTLKPGYPDLKNRAFVVKVNRLLRF